ncbi:histidine kinase [Flavobacterium sp.]|uniref:tetratricopeptide repeat-containing sensor histidine kinase n=1 Tax=Flavobacterium sp. TaxID=239 RepID=UPI00261E2F50|nr:histidine kinase [Flavobacterium sp.]
MRLQKIVLLLALVSFGYTAAQIRKGDAFRNKIDSLNRVAFDNPLSVIKIADQMLITAQKKKRIIDYSLLLQVKGIAETSLGNNSKALKLQMESYRIFDSIKQNEGKIFALINLAAVQLNLDQGKIAIEYLNKALSITPRDDYNSLKTIYSNLGVANDYEGNHQIALNCYNKAIPLLEKVQDNNGLSLVYHNRAVIYEILKDIPNAIVSELKAFEYQKKSKSLNSLAIIALNLGSLYAETGDFIKAEHYISMGGKASLESSSPYNIEESYLAKARLAKAKKDYKQEAGLLRELIDFKDSIRQTENMKINSELEKNFKLNLKNTEIELLKTQKKLDQSKLETINNTRLALLIITLFLGVIVFILFRNYKLKQKANLLLSYQKQELEEQNLKLENENILSQFETLKNQISPHFLFNSLNALSSLIKSNPNEAVEFTTVFSKLFRNTLQLKDHHLITLKEELEHVETYIKLQQIRFGANLIFSVKLDTQFTSRYLPPFALQMVIENAIKHNTISQTQPLEILITTENEHVVISNTLQLRKIVEDSTRTGINNIISRYKYITTSIPSFQKTEQQFIVHLPLIKE